MFVRTTHGRSARQIPLTATIATHDLKGNSGGAQEKPSLSMRNGRSGIRAPDGVMGSWPLMSTNADRLRAKSLNPLRALLPFLRPYRGMMIAALGALLVATVAMLALPVALRQLIDHVVAAKDASTLNRYLIGFLAASVIFGVFAALRFYLVTWLGERVVAELRSGVYPRGVSLDALVFYNTPVGA